ncbi:hypothetical protein K466DRAFT_663849 [Polyporus arcularius HHB13444]|uniref:F-box domain-containing protein n=1 Tax=Polyporus arcularius HHB13444 TaxID=1314778 RepID=A0A5C3PDN9_9APHY|nr:hypothetical protein K466DRAFT_663849 [Polyporus arcularius HHB13444]
MATPLNDDVLIAIMAILVWDSARSTAAAMMLSSRRLYHEGGKLLLSRNVDLRTSSQVSSFIAFCLAEKASRATYVRDLTLATYPLSPALASSLAELVPMFIGIKKLALIRADLLLRGHEALAEAFTSLTSLEDLSLLKGSTSGDLLITLKSSNLRKLTLYETVIPRPLRTGVRTFAGVSTLHITYLWMDILIMDPYIRVFPHVSSLSVTYAAIRERHSNYPSHPAFGALGGARDTQNVRCINQAAQTSGRGWEDLEQLETDLPTAWVLGLSCKVKRLALYIPHDRDLRLLPDVLADVRPEVLELTLAGDEFLKHPVAVAHVLDTLTVTLSLGKQDIDVMKSCVAHVAQCFVPSGVRSFRLRLGNSDEWDGESSREHSPPLEWSEEIDIEGWAQEIRHEMPSLEEVEVEVTRHVRAH